MQAVTQTWPMRCLGFGGPTAQEKQSSLDMRVAKEAAVSLGTTAGAFALNVALAQYVVLPLGITMFSWLLTGALFCTAASAVDYGVRRLSGSKPESHSSLHEITTGIATLSTIHFIGQAGPHALVHEAGHVLAARSLLKDSRPYMNIHSFGNSTTTYFNTRDWTSLGRMLGPQTSVGMIAVAGVAASVALCMLLSTAAHFVRKSHPKIAQIMELWGLSQLITDVAYGVLTLVVPRKINGADNDFLVLQQTSGISPLCTLSGMILVPALYRLGLAAIEWHQERQRAQAEAAKAAFSVWRPTTWMRPFSSS